MMHFKKYILAASFLLIAFSVDTGFAMDKINVTVSILPLAEFAEKVGGDLAVVSVMAPRGSDLHSYEPTPRQLIDLNHSQMYVKVGSSIEFELAWMDKLAQQNPDMYICNASKGVALLEISEPMHAFSENNAYDTHHHQTNKDPHIWLSPENAKIMVKNICESFIIIDPENKSTYIKNANAFIVELSLLEAEIDRRLKHLITREFLVFHPAWGYFARDFNLIQIAVEQSGKEPTPKKLKQLIDYASEHNIKNIFASPQFNQKSAQVIAGEINGSVDLIDSLAKDYVNNLMKVTMLLTKENAYE